MTAMRTLSPDTSPEAEAILVDLARRMSPRRKMEIAFSMTEMVRQAAFAGLCSRHSRATPEELHRRLAALLLPGELASAVYGWDPSRDGH